MINLGINNETVMSMNSLPHLTTINLIGGLTMIEKTISEDTIKNKICSNEAISVNHFCKFNKSGKLFFPNEIINLFPCVTARQITDFAEKGIVIPTVNTIGRGTPRLYDLYGVFDIVTASSLRGTLKPGMLRMFISRYKDGVGILTIGINSIVSISFDINRLIDKIYRKINMQMPGGFDV